MASIRSTCRRSSSCSKTAAVWFGLTLLAAGPTLANGRYPSAQNLAFAPGGEVAASGHPRIIALQTTFGLVTTTDGGVSWRHACEEAIGFSTDWDPALAVTASGALVSGLPSGLVTAGADYCAFTRPMGAPEDPIIDLTVDARGRRLVGSALKNGVAISDDDGVTWRRGWVMDRMLISTIDVAPGHPDRIYATGYLDFKAVLIRSDDGGQTFTEVTRDFLGGQSPWLVAVDGTNPDVLYLRVDLATAGTLFARSTDGGRTLQELVRTGNPMTGAAVSDDGRTLWVGSAGKGPRDGIFRSTDAGQTWQLMSQAITPLCLRHQGQFLYACADGGRDGFAVGFSRDGGATFTPLLTWAALVGPEGCPAGSPGRTLCESDWARLRNTLVPPPRDAGADASLIDGADATLPPADASIPVDAAGPDAAAPAETAGGCSCRMTGGAVPGWLALLVLALLARRLTR